MSFITVPGAVTTLPSVKLNAITTMTQTQLNAAGEKSHYVGYVILENPLGGSKTISAAGGGSIVWKANLCTFANAGSTMDIGIQDVSTATAPAQGDGTFDVKASFTGGGGGITSNAINTSVMTTGTKTIAHGALIAIAFDLTARGGTDSILISHNIMVNLWGDQGMPQVSDNVTGTFVRNSTAMPNAYIVFDDGSIGWLFGTYFQSVAPTTQTFNSGTGTADEYGNLLYYPHTFYAFGIAVLGNYAGTSSDTELLLYSTPLGTPAVQRTITVDATQLGLTAGMGHFFHLFSTPYLVKAYTEHAVTIRPTTANNVSIYYTDTNSSVGGKTGSANSNCYAVRRLDNSGAFSDYNGGTAKTRRMSIALLGSYMEQGVNMCSGQVGVY